MSWQLVYSPAAVRDLKKLDPEIASRVMGALEVFASTDTGDVKRLQGIKPPEWRLRVGDYRAGLAIDGASRTVGVLYVRHRREAYR